MMLQQAPATIIALIGNSGVGKTTVFHGLIGRQQKAAGRTRRTGQTVRGSFYSQSQEYLLIDFPGFYSRLTKTPEETVAAVPQPGQAPHMIVLVCDATRMERELRLLKQLLKLEDIKKSGLPVILCINRWDLARSEGIDIDLPLLRDVLQIPVVRGCAHDPLFIRTIGDTIRSEQDKNYTYDCLDFSPELLAAETIDYTHATSDKWEQIAENIVFLLLNGDIIAGFLFIYIFWYCVAIQLYF